MFGALLQQQEEDNAAIAAASIKNQNDTIQARVDGQAKLKERAAMAKSYNNFFINPLNSNIDNAKRRKLDGTESAKAPYFYESNKVVAATSSKKLDLVNLSFTTAKGRKAPITKERQSIIDVLLDPNKSKAAKDQLEKLMCNQASQQVAESRLMTYKITMQVAGLQAWPATYQKVITFISAAIAGEYPHKGLESMVSDVVNATGRFPQDDKDRVRTVINRLKKKGIIGIREQKRPITLRHIGMYSPEAAAKRPRIVQTRVELLIGFYGAFRRKEAAAMTFLGPLDETPKGFIGVRLDDVDRSVHFDLSKFIQKGGPRCARHVRVFCSCKKNKAHEHMCLVCSEENRSVIRNIYNGFDLGNAVSILGKDVVSVAPHLGEEYNNMASHSCRIGLAVHLFINGVDTTHIIHHARWSDDSMVLYYARNSKKFSRPGHWTNTMSWLQPPRESDKGEEELLFEEAESESEGGFFEAEEEG